MRDGASVGGQAAMLVRHALRIADQDAKPIHIRSHLIGASVEFCDFGSSPARLHCRRALTAFKSRLVVQSMLQSSFTFQESKPRGDQGIVEVRHTGELLRFAAGS